MIKGQAPFSASLALCKEPAMARQQRNFSADFKTRVALEALREQKTINELASEFGVHPNLIREWKKHLLDELPQVFSSHKAAEEKTEVQERERMFHQIGQLQYELAWLKQKAGLDR
jgi:transposase-like protein